MRSKILIPLIFIFVTIGALYAQNADFILEIESLHKQGKTDLALEKIDKIIAQDSKNLQARFAKGLLLAETNRINEAISIFQKISVDHPEMPEPYNNLAVLYMQQKNYEKSRIALEMAIRTHPSYAVAYENLGEVYAKLASQSYDKAFKLDSSKNELPSRMALLRNIGNIGTRKPPSVGENRLATAAPVINSKTIPVPASSAVNTTQANKIDSNALASKPISSEQSKLKLGEKLASNEQSKKQTLAKLDQSKDDKKDNKDNGKNDKSDKSENKAKVDEKSKLAEEKEQQKKQIVKSISSWGNAWASKNVNSYFSHYVGSFQPSGMSSAQWQRERRERLNKPGVIDVKTGSPRIVIDKNTAVATFPLNYRSQTLNTHASKTLEFTLVNGKWLISKESGR